MSVPHKAQPTNPVASFTLIELLIVIGIVAVLAVVTVVVLNPAELLKQSRDSKRLTDLTTLNKALKIVEVDAPSATFGTSTIVYTSLADTSSTCGSWNLPALPAGYTYNCVSSANLQKTDGTGWVPVNFTLASTGSPISSLPIDPVNASSTRNYYTYVPGGSWELATSFESAKYKLGGGSDRVSQDGGQYTGLYETGSTLTLLPIDYSDPSLVGYWKFDEGAGTSVNDFSGGGNSGAWTGTTVWTTGKVGAYAGSFNGGSDSVSVLNVSVNTAAGAQNTAVFWMKASLAAAGMPFGWNTTYDIWMPGSNCIGFNTGNGSAFGTTYAGIANNWVHIAAVFFNGTLSSSNVKLYITPLRKDSLALGKLRQMLLQPMAQTGLHLLR